MNQYPLCYNLSTYFFKRCVREWYLLAVGADTVILEEKSVSMSDNDVLYPVHSVSVLLTASAMEYSRETSAIVWLALFVPPCLNLIKSSCTFSKCLLICKIY